MTDLKKNAVRTILADGCYNLSLMCCSGPVVQTFLDSLGFPNRWIYINTMLIQTVNMLTIFLCARWADNGNIVRRSSGTLFPQFFLFLCYVPLCIWRSASYRSFILITVVCILQAVITGLYTVCIYKLPYVVMDASTYTWVIAISGLISGGLSLVSGLVLAYLAGMFSYPQIMLGGCITAGCLTVLASVLVGTQKPIQQRMHMHRRSEKYPIIQMLRQPVFYLLAPANLVRGFSMGVISVLTVVALELGFDEQTSTAIVSVHAAATILMCCFFGVFAKQDNLGRLILIGSLAFLMLPFLMKSQTGRQFLLGYFVICLGKVIIDYAIPAILRWIVPGEMAGIYQAWRMALTNGGMMLGTMTAALISSRFVMIVSAGTMVAAGSIYYFAIRQLRHTTP